MYFIFVACLAGIITILFVTFLKDNHKGLTFNDLSFFGVIGRISLTLPLIWLAAHANKAINRRSNLYEDYNYRQMLMELYVGFKDQNTNTPQGAENIELLTKIVFENIITPPGKNINPDSDNPIEKILSVFGHNPKGKIGKKLEDTESNP